jgi:hypothetical protein
MLRLGMRLTLRSGREALVRLLLTLGAVAIGVTVLLALAADYHAFLATTTRPSWESTTAAQGSPPASAVALWNYSETIYQGKFIEQLDVAALGPQAPTVPGIPRLPGTGEYDASPALAALLRSVPRDQLGDRFPGSQIGTIGNAALSGPDELAVIVGYPPSQLAALPNTIRVDHVATDPRPQSTTNLYRMAFGLGAIAVLFPLLILINTATRLAAARREERYAAMRLVGATPRQVNVVASVDAIVGALLGTVGGIAIFLLLRPALGGLALSGARFFAPTVTPAPWVYVATLAGVPLAAAVASRLSLRRVQISPLGVSRRVTPPAPRPWRLIPLLAGIPLFLYAVSTELGKAGRGPGPKGSVQPALLGFVLIMLGLVLAGSWLTMQAARLLAKVARGASSLLAARRLADNPKGSFRIVSGLVLAVLVGTAIAGLVPALKAAQSPGVDAELNNVLRVTYQQGPEGNGLPPEAGAQLIRSLQAFAGVTVLPIYANHVAANPGDGPPPSSAPPDGTGVVGDAGGGNQDNVILCSSFRQLPVLGHCNPGMTAVQTNADNVLFTDNPLFVTTNLPIVNQSSPPAAEPSGLPLGALLVKTADAATLERVRTFLTGYGATVATGKPGLSGQPDLSAWQMGSLEPETFGEVAQIRNNDATNAERMILALLGLTVLVAGCSLAVTVGGSLVERRRQFTLLRVSGTPRSVLTRVVLMESVLPLVTASVVAAATGLGVAIALVKAVLPSVVPTTFPGAGYYLTMAGGFAVALLVVLATLPLLGRITQPERARFE